MDSTTTISAKANLKKYINVDGKWRFVPVVKLNGKPQPKIVLIDGVPVASTVGTYYLEWRQDGKRIQKPVGSSPREALNAWRVQCGQLSEHPVPNPDSGPTADGKITTAIELFLREVKATKSEATYRAYSTGP